MNRPVLDWVAFGGAFVAGVWLGIIIGSRWQQAKQNYRCKLCRSWDKR